MSNILFPIITLIVIALLVYVMANAKKKDDHFDEMQLIKRLNGYKLGFFVLLIELGVYAGLSAFYTDLKDRVEPSIAIFMILLVGILCFAVYCIFNEAFFAMGENTKVYSVICAAVVLINCVNAYSSISKGDFLKDGVITFDGTGNIAAAAVFAIILVCIIVKSVLVKKEADE